MKRDDPFTTDKARVPLAVTDAAIKREGESWQVKARQIFGQVAFLQFKQYFGAEGGWRCGFTSWYGVHVRGNGKTAEEAVTAAMRARLPDDPKPGDLSWVPSSYKAPYSPHRRLPDVNPPLFDVTAQREERSPRKAVAAC